MSKLAVITGGTKGIGRAVVDRFAAEGFDIATCSRQGDALEGLKRDMAKYKVTVDGFVADLSNRKEAETFTTWVLSLGKPVDVLVNNAGSFHPGHLIDEQNGTLESMIGANLYSAYYTTRGLVKEMKRLKNGHVFNMCSVASIKAYPNGGSYAISKFALLGFTKGLREELKDHGVRVTAVIPGATRTSSWDSAQLPDDRFIRPEDVAEAIYGAYSLSARSVVEEILIRPQLGDI
ncbi:MAG: SDR family oxidoreductase [Cyclobacteriaceae bacterium]|nr:SDR family oxidoreductase [Cyclobacteriaceae bacterium]